MPHEICDTDAASAWWTCEDCEHDQLVSYAALAESGRPICPLCDSDMALADEDDIAKRHKVVIAVRGGVAAVQFCPENIQVEIVDYDNLDAEPPVTTQP